VRQALRCATAEPEQILAAWIDALLASTHALAPKEVEYLTLLREVTQEGTVTQPHEETVARAMQSAALDRMQMRHHWSETAKRKNSETIARDAVPAEAAQLIEQIEAEDKTPEDNPSAVVLGAGTLVFCYGSLLHCDSISMSLGRPVLSTEFAQANLVGHRLAWGVPTTNFSLVDKLDRSASADVKFAALVLIPERCATVDGALIALNDQEVERIDERERSYNRVDVSAMMQLHAGTLGTRRVFTYIPKAEKVDVDQNCRVRKGYLDMVVAARDGFTPVPTPPEVADYVDPDELARSAVWEQPFSDISWPVTLNDFLAKDGVFRTKMAGDTAPSLDRPLLISDLVFDQITAAAEAAVHYSSEQLRVVLDNNELAERYGISEFEVELARHFAATQPIPEVARVDLVASKGEVSILEVNADSPAGLHHFSSLARHLQTWRGVIDDIPIDFGDAVTSMEIAAEAILGSLPDRKRLGVAIVEKRPDMWPSYHEMKAFEKLFEELGAYKAVVCDPDKLQLDSTGQLEADGLPVQIVYKRALWRDLQGPGATALLQAATEGTVTVRNSLFARLAGNKRFLADLWTMSTSVDGHRLEGFVPETHVAIASNDTLVNDVIRNPTDWVLKGFRGFAGKEFVAADANTNLNEWTNDVRSIFDTDHPTHIAQRRKRHGEFVVNNQPGRSQKQRSVYGAYVVNGRCVGIEAKLGRSLPISMNNNAVRAVVATVRPGL